MRKMVYSMFFPLLSVCMILLGGCGKAEEESREATAEVKEFTVENLLEFCVHPESGDLYCSLSGESVICHYDAEGKYVEQFPVTADEDRELRMFVLGRDGYEQELTGLCINGDTLYCYRMAKQTVIALDLATGESRVCMDTENITVHKAETLENTILFYGILTAGIGASNDSTATLLLLDLDTGKCGELSVGGQPMGITKDEESGAYWIIGYEEGTGCFLQKYDPKEKVLSERYATGLQDIIEDIAYVPEEKAIYGYVLNTMEYVKMVPEDAQAISRFLVRPLQWGMPRMQVKGEKLYMQGGQEGTIYAFDPEGYLAKNKPLKGYVLQTADIDNWLGYNIDLEKISWEDLALKVLAGDADFDFVILSTDMPEVLAMRNAMTFQPIPEESIADYWENCQPLIREAAVWQGDIWMLPLNVRAEGIVYNEEKLAEYGIDMPGISTWDELHRLAEKLYEDGKENYYSVYKPWSSDIQYYTEAMVRDSHIDYDTPEFRALMERTQEWEGSGIWASYINIGNEPNMGHPVVEEESLSWEEREEKRWTDFLSKVYFEQVRTDDSWGFKKYEGRGDFRVCRVPRRGEADDYVRVTADVLIINPRSANLEDALKFASDMASAYLENPATHLSARPELYGEDAYTKDILALYARGRLCFGYPDEIFEPYYDWLLGEMDADAMIEELNRKVNMYLGE